MPPGIGYKGTGKTVKSKRKIGSGGKKGSAALRAFSTLSKDVRSRKRKDLNPDGSKLSRDQRVSIGKRLRNSRATFRSDMRFNPNTGARETLTRSTKRQVKRSVAKRRPGLSKVSTQRRVAKITQRQIRKAAGL